jgi:hypothetical protein
MLVMRLETAAAKLERRRRLGDIDNAELVDLLKEAAKEIKKLEWRLFDNGRQPNPANTRTTWLSETYPCGND